MKRGTIEHPKTRQLARELGCPIYAVVGMLECLWHFTARYARRGDIGRFTNEQIAEAVFWTGDVTQLMAALTSTPEVRRWIDPDVNVRLCVHDWPHHADDAVKKALKRNGEEFVVPAPVTNGITPRVKATQRQQMPLLPVESSGNGAKPKNSRRAPADFELTQERKQVGFDQGLVLHEVQHEFAKFMDCEFKPPGHSDWDATLRNWFRKAGEDKHGGIRPPAVQRGS